MRLEDSVPCEPCFTSYYCALSTQVNFWFVQLTLKTKVAPQNKFHVSMNIYKRLQNQYHQSEPNSTISMSLSLPFNCYANHQRANFRHEPWTLWFFSTKCRKSRACKVCQKSLELSKRKRPDNLNARLFRLSWVTLKHSRTTKLSQIDNLFTNQDFLATLLKIITCILYNFTTSYVYTEGRVS